MSDLMPEIQQAIDFVAAAAIGGVVGNRADSWFVSLYYHERQRISLWLQSWKLTEKDKQLINSDDKIKVLFSQITSNVANEIFEKKLLIWPTITESLIRNDEFNFDKKQFFISLFIKMETFTLNFLANLCLKGRMGYEEVFPGHNENKNPSMSDKNYSFYLRQLQSSSAGTTELFFDVEAKTSYIRISELGNQFVDFISNSSIEKLKEMAGE